MKNYGMERPHSPEQGKFVVLGVGTSGCDAVNHMIFSGLKRVLFIAADGDEEALERNEALWRIHPGEDSIALIKDCLAGASMLFLAAGMGGVTGTLMAPILARVAREMGILTLAIAALPSRSDVNFGVAREGLELLKDAADAVIPLPLPREESDKLSFFAPEPVGLGEASYRVIRDILEIVDAPGRVNLDFWNIKNVLSEAGWAFVGTGVGWGKRRAERAARNAIQTRLRPAPIRGARSVLVNVRDGGGTPLEDLAYAAEIVKTAAAPQANVVWGHVIDEEIKGGLRMTVVASGFER